MFTNGGRTVRCAKCQNVWTEMPPGKAHPPIVAPQQTPSASIPIPSDSPTPPKNDTAAEIPAVKAEPINWLEAAKRYLTLTKIAALIVSGLLLFTVVVFIAGHRFLIREWPHLQRYYIDLGLAQDPLKDNLEIQNIQSERRYMDGAMQLFVRGEIHSSAKKRQVIPAIVVEALGPDGHVIESWRIEPPQATMAPEETVSFSSSVVSPEETVVEVNLSFVEPPHDEP